MTKLTNKSTIINTIRLIKSPKFREGASFLINEGTNSQTFLNLGFVRNIFTGLGLSTKTPFLKLVGSVINFKTFTLTQEMLDEAKGEYVVDLPGRNPITFKSIGVKELDHSLAKTSDQFNAQVNAAALEFETDWAGTPAPVAQQTPPVAKPEEHVEEPANQTVQNQPGNAEVNEEVNLDEETM